MSARSKNNRHTDPKDVKRFPPWAVGAYYRLGVPSKELRSGSAYVMEYDNKVEIVQILELGTNEDGDVVSIQFVPLAHNRKEQKKTHWEEAKSVYKNDIDEVYLSAKSLPESNVGRWKKPAFYYPAYLKNVGGGRTIRRSRRASTRRSTKGRNL